MNRSARSLTILMLVALSLSAWCRAESPPATVAVKDIKTTISSSDWPGWRGPRQSGITATKQELPLTWSKTENILWKSPVPGRAHGSPIVVGNFVYITAAEIDAGLQSVLCFDRTTGDQKWKTVIHKGNLETKGNAKSSQASSTLACDGQRLFINFLNGGAIYTTALDLAGKQLWQKKISDFKTHQGFGSSPMLFGDRVYVSTDSPGGGVVASLDAKSGDIVWTKERPKKANYASAIVHRVAGKDQLVIHGCDLITSFDPISGDKLWEIDGATTECVATLATDGERIFTSGGYPRNHVQAVLGDGSGKTAWENGARVYVPSMIVYKEHLYAVQDGGIAMCWKCDTGEERWKKRVGGDFSASLVLVETEKEPFILATSETGKTTIFAADPEKFRSLAENQLGDEVFATTAVSGNQLFMRVAERENGKRMEWLYCIGKK